MLVGTFRAGWSPYDVDVTLLRPGGGEYVSYGMGQFSAGFPLAASGWRGNRRPTGSLLHEETGAGWADLRDMSTALGNMRRVHTDIFGGLALHPLASTSFSATAALSPLGESYWGNAFFGQGTWISTQIRNERDVLDWSNQAGRVAAEVEPNEAPQTSQDLDALLAAMAGDGQARNDRAVIVGRVTAHTDLDVYRFTAAAGETWVFDVDAAEFQSPLDARVRLLDASGSELFVSLDARDWDSGLSSADPLLRATFAAAGTYYVEVSAERRTFGNYRLKVVPERAFPPRGPRVLASLPDGGTIADGTRQLVFWFDDQVDPETLTSENIVVRGQTGGVRPGSAWFDPLDVRLVWRADEPLPPDDYTVILRGGPGGIRNLRGALLDGETDGVMQWPEVSGDGSPGGDFVTALTIDQADTQPASAFTLFWSSDFFFNRSRIAQLWNDDLDVRAVSEADLRLRGAGPDGAFGTSDDTRLPVDWHYDSLASVGERVVWLYSRRALDPGGYTLEGSLLDAAGHALDVPALTVSRALGIVPEGFLHQAPNGPPGLVASFVDQSLRGRPDQDDWRTTQAIAGTRVDRVLHFPQNGWGSRATVGLTKGTDADWQDFSVQWDGYVTIPTDGVRLYTRSDDGSRMWIDLDGDGTFGDAPPELVNNNWGGAQSPTTGPASPPLAAGTYAVRIQYEEGGGGNALSLLWDYTGHGGAGSRPREARMPPAIVELSFQPNGPLLQAPEELRVRFSGAIDPASLTTETMLLRWSPDTRFFDDNDLLVAAAADAIAWDASGYEAVFRPAQQLDPGYYLLEVRSGPSGVRTPWGVPLDGEFLAGSIRGTNAHGPWSFSPSGDGIPGGDYRVFFVVVDVTPPDAPPPPDLADASDTGGSSTDNVTRLTTLTFTGLAEPRSRVVMLANGGAIGETAADAAGAYSLDVDLAEGTWSLQVTATDLAGNMSQPSDELVVSVDTTSPSADISDVSPDPRGTPVDAIDIVFSEPVAGLSLHHLALTRDGGPNLLTGAETLATADAITWTLSAIADLTRDAGTYLLTLSATGEITDLAGNPLPQGADESWTVAADVQLFVDIYTDAGGNPGARLDDDTVYVGQQFFVVISAADLRATPAGLIALAIDMAWDAALLVEIDDPFDPADPGSRLVTPSFPLFRGGTLDAAAGSVDELQGASLPEAGEGAALGVGAPEVFSVLHFQALAVSDGMPLSVLLGNGGVALADGETEFLLGIEPLVLTILEAPRLEVQDSSGDPADQRIAFQTPLSQYRPRVSDSPLVRPNYPDDRQYVDVANSGESPLTISEILVNAPDVSVTPSLTGDPSDDVVLLPGQIQRFVLRYAPSVPTAADPTRQDFDLTDGLVILSNAENAPRLEIALRGRSTYNSDITYDGKVNFAELGILNSRFGRKAGDADWDPTADINGDGRINLADLGLFNAEFGRGVGGAAAASGTSQAAAAEGDRVAQAGRGSARVASASDVHTTAIVGALSDPAPTQAGTVGSERAPATKTATAGGELLLARHLPAATVLEAIATATSARTQRAHGQRERSSGAVNLPPVFRHGPAAAAPAHHDAVVYTAPRDASAALKAIDTVFASLEDDFFSGLSPAQDALQLPLVRAVIHPARRG